MRVIHILWTGETGGAERSVYQLAKYQRHHAPFDVAIGFGQARGDFAQRAVAEGIHVHDFAVRSGRDFLSLPRARAMLQEYDVHHFHGAEPVLMIASLLCPGARRVYTHRGGVMDYKGRRALRYRMVGTLLRTGFAGITAAPQATRAVEKIFGIRASAVVESLNGVDVGSLEPTKAREDIRTSIGCDNGGVLIGTAATLRELKRVDWLIRAAARLPEGNWKLVILGDGPDRRRLEMLARDMLGRERISFVGMVTDIGSWLNALDVFVLPSGPEEGFGNAVVEAMAFGLPVVVCSDSPALTAHVRSGTTGTIVDGVGEMAGALDLLINEPAARRELGRAAREDVSSRYSMERCSRVFERQYEQLSGARAVDASGEMAV
jgi:glycosyltransferase involved in cell wall biosynthesis